MAYDSYNYDIKSKLMEWWREDTLLEPINRYSQKIIRDLIGSLMGSFGVVQPFQVWKTLPTEYSWSHTYHSDDEYLKTPYQGDTSLRLRPNSPIRAYVPNSKRNCHAVIELNLQGDKYGIERPLKKITLKNANQKITIKDITTTTSIKILTDDDTILIDGVQNNDLINGRFNKIYPQARDLNYDNVDIDDENKITYIEIESDSDYDIDFDLKIRLIHPVYVTEQNIRIHTLSAFPIEWVKLYGFYCHDFNNKQEWRFLWEKNYKESERVVYDRITKQFDCETFYIQVKLYGIGIPFYYGFPQQILSSNSAFQINDNLDKWGKIYGLPRRAYKTKISEDEEPYTYPPYYNYNIEQDYWYEERLVNEYRHNDDAINTAFVLDSDLDNVGILQCIYPKSQDIYVYTETIKSDTNNKKQTDYISPTSISEEGEGATWDNSQQIIEPNSIASEVLLLPNTSETTNSKENQAKILSIHFDEIPELPKNIEIKGLELQLNGLTDIHSTSLILDDRSQLLLPTIYTRENGEVFRTIDNIQINNDIQYWEKGKKIYTIGGENDLFNLQQIKKEQIQDGITFNLGFKNLNEFLKATIALYSIKLIIHYEIIHDSYDVNVIFDNKEIVLSDDSKQEINMKIELNNNGKVPIVNKNVYIATPKELNITNKKFPSFDLEIGEKFVIGELPQDKIVITPTDKTGLYDIIVFCDDKVIRNEITVREGLH